jgi:hypothetical protein
MSDSTSVTGGHAAGRPRFDIKAQRHVPQPIAQRIRALAQRPPEPSAAAVALARGVHPGTERWPVKTGTDPDAAQVGTNAAVGADSAGIVDSSVEEMINLPRPPGLTDLTADPPEFHAKRAAPVEFTIWQVKADITFIKKENDGDLHMVLTDANGNTMVAESPIPRSPFVENTSPWLDAMAQVRTKIAEKFGSQFAGKQLASTTPGAGLVQAPATHPGGHAALFEAIAPFQARIQPTAAVVTGVGFFDRFHGQTGVAKNVIELHPVLDIEFP